MTEGRGAERPRRGRRSSRAPIRAMRPFLESRYRILAVALVLSLAGTGVWLVAAVFQNVAIARIQVNVPLLPLGIADFNFVDIAAIVLVQISIGDGATENVHFFYHTS